MASALVCTLEDAESVVVEEYISLFIMIIFINIRKSTDIKLNCFWGKTVYRQLLVQESHPKWLAEWQIEGRIMRNSIM